MQHALDRSASLVALAGILLAPLLAWPIVHAPKLAVGALMIVLLEGLLIRAPHWGVPLMAAGMLFDDVFVPTPFALLGPGDLTTFAVVPVWLLHRLLKMREGQIGPYWYLPAFYLAWSFLSMMVGINPQMAFGTFARECTYIVAMFAIVDLCREPRVIEHAFKALSITGFFIAMHAMLTAPTGYRIIGFSESNVLGMRLGYAALPTLGLLLRAKRQASRVLYSANLMVILAAIILTISRGTYISFGVAFLWWSARYRRLVFFVSALLVGAIFIAPMLVKDAPSADAIQARFEMRDTSVVNRWQVLLNSVDVIIEKPLVGVGFGQFTQLHKVVDVTAEKERGSHSYYIGIAAASGLPVLVALLFFLGFTARALWRKRAEAEAHKLEHAAWAISVLQALMIFHMFTLIVRGATRMAEWYMFGLYVAGTLLITSRQTGAPPEPPPDEGAGGSGPSPTPASAARP